MSSNYKIQKREISHASLESRNFTQPSCNPDEGCVILTGAVQGMPLWASLAADRAELKFLVASCVTLYLTCSFTYEMSLPARGASIPGVTVHSEFYSLNYSTGHDFF